MCLCAQLALTTWAAPVTQSQALKVANWFVQQKQGVSRSLKAAAQSPTLQAAANNGYYYVFNVGDGNGFVIVSGDDRTTPILGYSDEGALDAGKIPANMQSWLDGYSLQMQALSTLSNEEAAMRLAAPRKTTTVDTRNSIAPMITSKWDQATPYWNECPEFMSIEDGDTVGELAYTGCVATAMSQIMYFYKQPAATLAQIPAYQFVVVGDNYTYSTVSMDAQPITTFDWAHMRDTYTGAESEEYTSAVAHLMLYAGCSVKMQYGISGSAAYTDDIPKGFKYFGYGSQLAFRADYTQEAWDNLVYSELAAGRPMVYNGTAGSGGGHSFVCDGYEYGDYFHINWGWSGMGNGFFQLAIMNPSASGIGGSSSAEGYNMKQNIVYNLIPGTATPDTEVDAEPVLTATAISGPSGWDRDKLSDGFKIYKSKIVKVSYSDHSGTGKRFKTALGLYDPSTDTYTVLDNSQSVGYFTVTTSALGETTSYGSGIQANASNVIKFGAGLTGTYRLLGMYQVEGSSEWLPMKESDRYYLEVTMASTSCTASAHPTINLQVTNMEFTGGERVGVKEQVHATIKNNSADRFFGDLYLDFGGQQIDEYSQYTTVVQAEVMPGEESVVTFNVTPTSSGTKAVKVMRLDQYGSYITIQNTGSVTIAASQEATELNLSVVIEATNADAATDSYTHGTIYDSHAQFKAVITNNGNGEYNKYVLAPLFIVSRNADGSIAGGSMVTYKQQALSLAAGESKTLYFDFDNLAYGSTYSMNVYARNYVGDSEEGSHLENLVESGQSKYYLINYGIVVWDALGNRTGNKPVENFQVPADAAAVSIESLSLSNINTNSNPNVIYLLGENQTVPSVLNGKNIVKGQNANSIVLQDGYPYFIPQSINATSVTYNRTFTTARTADQRYAWSTIVLPFNATSVKVGSRTATLGSDYWLYNFPSETDGEVTFGAATALEANVPYLVAVADGRDMTGQTVSWTASNVTLKADPVAMTSGENYLMTGVYNDLSENNIYAMDDNGTRFVYKTSAQAVAPFRAYFTRLQDVTATEILCPGSTEVTPPTPSYSKGDVNGDGRVDVTDINIIISIMMGEDSAENYDGRAYVTEGDTKVDVSDINEIISILLGN